MTSDKKAKPAFARMPWYPRDFASSTRSWPYGARLIYRELLDYQWDTGGSDPGVLPEDEEQLRLIANVPKPAWKNGWSLVKPKFASVPGGGLQNLRLEEHRAEALREFNARRRGAETTNRKLGRGSGAGNPATTPDHD